LATHKGEEWSNEKHHSFWQKKKKGATGAAGQGNKAQSPQLKKVERLFDKKHGTTSVGEKGGRERIWHLKKEKNGNANVLRERNFSILFAGERGGVPLHIEGKKGEGGRWPTSERKREKNLANQKKNNLLMPEIGTGIRQSWFEKRE